MDLLIDNTTPALKLVGDIEFKRCHECRGVGHVPCPQTVAVRTIGLNSVPALQPSTGHPIPCPSCNGAKVVANF
jgi:DnaJ-class molecular chaperone